MSNFVIQYKHMDTIKESLLLLGCSEKEISYFVSAFRMGAAPLSEHAKQAKLQRSTAYLIAQQLVDKGLLEHDHRNYNQHYTAASPDKLIRMVEAKKRRLARSSAKLQDSKPDLNGLFGNHDAVPHVTTYTGKNGLISIWNDILSTKSEILLWTNQEVEHMLFGTKQHGQFIRERTRKQIPIRVLAVDNPDGRLLLESDAKNFRQTKLLDDSTHFTAETYVYDNKVAIIDHTTDIIGIIIESRNVRDSQAAMFELTWRNAL